MRYKKANIDSLVLSDAHMEAIFICNEEYSIQTVKSRSIFEPRIWSETFGKSLKQNIIEAKIIHSHLGLCLPLKTFAVTPLNQSLELAGLHGYNERSQNLVTTFKELESQLQQSRIRRIDVCLDYEGKIPTKIIKSLSKNREAFLCSNTTYYKTEKESKTNQRIDIKVYNKSHQAKLDGNLMRLEFCFKGSYFDKLLLNDSDLAINTMEKSIKRLAGITIKIRPIVGLKR